MTREQLDDLITDTAAELFSALCEGDGEHSEALDRGIIEARLRAFAALAAPVAAEPHRCSGCGHTWDGHKGSELCGDCWRKAQPVVHSVAAEPPSLVALENLARDIGRTSSLVKERPRYIDKDEHLAMVRMLDSWHQRAWGIHAALRAWTPAQAEPAQN